MKKKERPETEVIPVLNRMVIRDEMGNVVEGSRPYQLEISVRDGELGFKFVTMWLSGTDEHSEQVARRIFDVISEKLNGDDLCLEQEEVVRTMDRRVPETKVKNRAKRMPEKGDKKKGTRKKPAVNKTQKTFVLE